MNWKVILVGGVLIVPSLVFLGVGLTKDPNHIESPLLEKAAPPFALQNMLNDGVVHLDDFEGKAVVVNFWATWCQPCLAEHPVFLAAERRYGDRVAFLGVIYQDDERNIRSFLARRGAWGTTLFDPSSEVSVAYGVYGIPETYLIDAQGVVAEKITGPVSPYLFFDQLEALLARTPES